MLPTTYLAPLWSLVHTNRTQAPSRKQTSVQCYGATRRAILRPNCVCTAQCPENPPTRAGVTWKYLLQNTNDVRKSRILHQKPKTRNPNSMCGFGIWGGQAGSGGDGHVSKPSQNQHLAGRLPKGTDGPPKPSRFAEGTFSRILLEIRDMEPGDRFPVLRPRHKLVCNEGLKDIHIYACLLFEHAW